MLFQSFQLSKEFAVKQGLMSILMLLVLLGLSACGSSPNRDDPNGSTPAATYVQLGMHYFREGEYKAALIKLRRALEIDPKSADAHGAIAILYEQMGNLDLAGEHYQQAVQANPNNPGLHNNYGTFLCKANRLEEAESHFLTAIKDPLYDTPEIAYTNAGICLRQKNDLAGAEKHFRSALQANARFPDALSQMVRLSYEQRNYLSARAFLQRYQIERELDASLLWLAILIEQALGDSRSMESYMLSLRTQHPDSAEARQLGLLEKQQLHTQIERATIQPATPANSSAQAWGLGSEQPLPAKALNSPARVDLPEPVQPLLPPPVEPAVEPSAVAPPLPTEQKPADQKPADQEPIKTAPVAESESVPSPAAPIVMPDLEIPAPIEEDSRGQ